MTFTKEQIDAVVGHYSMFDAIPDLTIKDMEPFIKALNAAGILPCGVCGAYRRNDRCQVCDKEKK